jgi:type II restriction/modification system DNA methylase subunit YeeA
MVGFDGGLEIARTLDGQTVKTIHSDLTSESNVASAVQLSENQRLCFLGIMKGGAFDINSEEARKMLERPMNPNGRPNSDVIKRRLGGQDISRRDRRGWIIDFGKMTENDASFYEMPFEYIRQKVQATRSGNRDPLMNKKWWLHGRSRPALRAAIGNMRRCIVTPEVNKHRIFVWMDTEVIPDHKVHIIARADDYFMGVLQSEIHEKWTLATCSWIGKGNDPSYNSETTFLTFPFPYPPGTEPSEAESPIVRAIAEAARELVRLRDSWLNPPNASEADLKSRTLTKLYNERPTWLDNAHRALDQAVFAAYGWPYPLPTQQVLANLLALNHQRAAAQAAQTTPPTPRRPGRRAQT